ncbi:MAG: Na+:solute symporter, partial [Bacteroidota bacterium]|nr:Na+:solute symporter [Bacteroidota bacterium]
DILLLSGAGSGAIYLLRWFWWRINAWTEIFAMFFATVMAIVLVFVVPDEAVATAVLDAFTVKLLIATGGTTIIWLLATFLTKPEAKETLQKFYKKTHPGGPGWKKVVDEAAQEGININEKEEGKTWELPKQILMVFIGCITIYSTLFSIGSIIYGETIYSVLYLGVSIVGTFYIFKLLKTLRMN